MDAARGPGPSVVEWGRRGGGRPGYASTRRIRLVAYGARLESVLGSRPRGFESRILRRWTSTNAGPPPTRCARRRRSVSVPVSLAVPGAPDRTAHPLSHVGADHARDVLIPG